MKFVSNRFAITALAAVVLVAVSVRAWGIQFGLPHLYHPDENVYVDISQRMYRTGDWNPHFFNYPSLFLYLNALAYYPYSLVRWVMGQPDFAGPQMLVMGVGQTPDPGTFVLGRFLTVAFGVGAVVLLYLSGKRLLEQTLPALMAAFLLAISSTAVINSRSITPDTFLLFFILLAFFGATRVYKEGQWKDYALAGVGIGLAGATKYNAVLIVLVLLAAHFLRHGLVGWKDKRLYGALALAGIIFFAATPFALLDFQTFISDLRSEGEHYLAGHMGMDGNTLYWYWVYLWSTEGIVIVLAALEVLRGLIIRSRPLVLLSIFPVTYFVFINGFAVRNDRTILPMLPFAFLLGASLLYQCWLWASKRIEPAKTIVQIGIATLGVAALVFPATQMVINSKIREDGVRSREEASAWVRGHIAPGARIAIEPYTPYVDPATYEVRAFGALIDNKPDWYKAQGFDYLIFSGGRFSRYFHEAERYPDEVARYNALFDSLGLMKDFPDERYDIRVYSTSASP